MQDFLEAIKSLGDFRDWLAEWLAAGEPALEDRAREVLSSRIGSSENDAINEYLHGLANKFYWRDQQNFADAFQKMKIVFEFQPKTGMGNWLKDMILRLLKEKEVEIDKELSDTHVLFWELRDLCELSKWHVVDEGVVGRVHI